MASNKKIITDIQGLLRTARQKSYSAVNFAMVEACWKIGFLKERAGRYSTSA